MWRFVFTLASFVSGILIGWFFPYERIRENLGQHYENALEAARQASEQRRAELESQLREMKQGYRQEDEGSYGD